MEEEEEIKGQEGEGRKGGMEGIRRFLMMSQARYVSVGKLAFPLLSQAIDILGESISSCHEQKGYPLFLGSLRIILCDPPSPPLPSHSLHPRRPSALLLSLSLPFPSCVHTIRGRGKERRGRRRN